MCWNIRHNSEEAFCRNSVKWPLSEDVYYSAVERDTEAMKLYQVLLAKWKRTKELDGTPEGKLLPKADCLAIAR